MSEETAEKRKPRIGAGKIIAIALAVLVAYCCIFSLVAKFIKGEAVPMPLGFGAAVVLTGSMEPTLKTNDLVIVARSKSYSVGDIVVFQTSGSATIHRLIEIDEENGVALTKGDANNTEDEPITTSKIRGKLLFRVPFVGFVMQYLKTVPGIIMMLVLLFTLLFLSVRAKDQDKSEEAKKSELERQIEELKKQIAEAAEAEKAEAEAGEAPREEEPEDPAIKE